jgi:hypothetical protein
MKFDSLFFTLFVIWYINRYGIPQNLIILYANFYSFCKKLCNVGLFLIYTDDLDDLFNKDDENNDSKEKEKEVEKIVPKYEDKFLTEIRRLEKEFIFDEQEQHLEQNKYNEIYKELLNEKNPMTEDEIEECKKIALVDARQFVIDKRIEKLNTCFVMESTPLGNVLMIWDNKRETFKYYSDNTIPYRYLEVVGRKYVKQFGCRPIFVDMEEELQIAEDKWERERKEKQQKEEEEKKRREEATLLNNRVPVPEKKNVFAKFKSYNRDAGTGHVSVAAAPKNSIPNTKVLTEKQENEKVLLKERANRYTYEGKFANFSFLKKADKKVFDKKLALTFADFKKLNQL